MKIAISFLLFLSASTHAQVKDEVDKFTGKARLSYSSEEKVVLDGRPRIILSWRDLDNTAQVFLFTGSTREWRYLACHSVNWLADGTPLTTGETTHQGEVSPPGRFVRVTESIVQSFTLEQMAIISTATQVKLRICNDEYALTPREIDGFRQFLFKARQR